MATLKKSTIRTQIGGVKSPDRQDRGDRSISQPKVTAAPVRDRRRVVNRYSVAEVASPRAAVPALEIISPDVGRIVGSALRGLLAAIARNGPSALVAAGVLSPSLTGLDPIELGVTKEGQMLAAQAAAAVKAMDITAKPMFLGTIGYDAVLDLSTGRPRHDWWMPSVVTGASDVPSSGSRIGDRDVPGLVDPLTEELIGSRGFVRPMPGRLPLEQHPSAPGTFSPAGVDVVINPIVASTGQVGVRIHREWHNGRPGRTKRENKEVGKRGVRSIMRVINATYGRYTEWMDLWEALRANLYRDGAPARYQYLSDRDLVIAWARGEVELDVVGATIDFSVSQLSDAAYARLGVVAQRGLNRGGWDKPIGIEMYSAPARWMVETGEYHRADEETRHALWLHSQLSARLDPVSSVAGSVREWLRSEFVR